MLRVDSETTEQITTQQAEQIVSQAKTLIEQAEVLVLSDYAKGCLFKDINHRLIKLAQANDVPVIKKDLTSLKSIWSTWSLFIFLSGALSL